MCSQGERNENASFVITSTLFLFIMITFGFVQLFPGNNACSKIHVSIRDSPSFSIRHDSVGVRRETFKDFFLLCV